MFYKFLGEASGGHEIAGAVAAGLNQLKNNLAELSSRSAFASGGGGSGGTSFSGSFSNSGGAGGAHGGG